MEVVVDAAPALVTTNPEVHFVTPEIEFPKYHRPYRGFSECIFNIDKTQWLQWLGTFTG
jgi:hypothetical protein